MFTSSFKEDMDPIVFIPPEDKTYDESSNMSINQTTAISSSKKMIGFKKQIHTGDNYSLYFQSLTKKNVLKQEKVANSFNDDMAKLLTFIEAEMKELHPYKKLYATTKYQIQKLLMKAKLKIASWNFYLKCV